MKNIALLLAAFLFTQALFAQDAEESSVESSRSLLLQISTLPEAKLTFTQQFKIPFLRGDNALTQDNNIKFALGGEITPVSLNGLFKTVLTPIAFFEFELGGRVGSGWHINLFGGDIYGIGLNTKDKPNKADGSAFDGALWEAHAGGAIQFDLAAIVPGEWNHVVFKSYHEINHKTYSRAGKGQAWFYEDDFGENCNGLNYYGNLLLGYQMPIFLDTVALLAEGDLYLYDTPNRELWGDERVRWTFAFVLSFTFTKKFGAALITQFRTMRNYEQSNWEELYYRDLTINRDNPLRLEFYRVAAAVTYRF